MPSLDTLTHPLDRDTGSSRSRRTTREPITVTVQDTKRLSGLGNTKLYELIGSGKLETVMIDGRRLVNYASLKRLLGA